MKKLLILIIALLSIIMTSCDRFYYAELYISNNCNQLIFISDTSTWNTVDTFSVDANTTFMYYKGEGITSAQGIVEHSSVKFEVFKDGVLSKVNYIGSNRWIHVAGTDKYHSKMYLHVNPEDFE